MGGKAIYEEKGKALASVSQPEQEGERSRLDRLGRRRVGWPVRRISVRCALFHAPSCPLEPKPRPRKLRVRSLPWDAVEGANSAEGRAGFMSSKPLPSRETSRRDGNLGFSPTLPRDSNRCSTTRNRRGTADKSAGAVVLVRASPAEWGNERQTEFKLIWVAAGERSFVSLLANCLPYAPVPSRGHSLWTGRPTCLRVEGGESVAG
jgi:hypothetical protein